MKKGFPKRKFKVTPYSIAKSEARKISIGGMRDDITVVVLHIIASDKINFLAMSSVKKLNILKETRKNSLLNLKN